MPSEQVDALRFAAENLPKQIDQARLDELLPDAVEALLELATAARQAIYVPAEDGDQVAELLNRGGYDEAARHLPRAASEGDTIVAGAPSPPGQLGSIPASLATRRDVVSWQVDAYAAAATNGPFTSTPMSPRVAIVNLMGRAGKEQLLAMLIRAVVTVVLALALAYTLFSKDWIGTTENPIAVGLWGFAINLSIDALTTAVGALVPRPTSS